MNQDLIRPNIVFVLVDDLGYWGLDDAGRCASCGAPCPGVFESGPGSWDGHRLPVRMGH